MMMEMCLPKRERRRPRRGDGAAAAVHCRRQRRPAQGGAPPLCPPSSLDLIGAVEEPSPLEMAAKGEAIS
jgi:hypothetical protein